MSSNIVFFFFLTVCIFTGKTHICHKVYIYPDSDSYFISASYEHKQISLNHLEVYLRRYLSTAIPIG